MAFGSLTLRQSPQLKLDLFPAGQARDVRVNDLQVLQKGYNGSWVDVFDLKTITPNSVEQTATEKTFIKVFNDSVTVSYDGVSAVKWYDSETILSAGQTFKGAIIELCAKSSDGVIIANVSVARSDDTIRDESSIQFLQSFAGNKTELLKHIFVNQSNTKSLEFRTTDNHPIDVYIHYTSRIFYTESL